MKKVFRLLTVGALATTFALPAFASSTSASLSPSAFQDAAQNEEAKAQLYKEFLQDRGGDAAAQKRAYEKGKEYISKYGSDTSENNAQIVAFIQKWIGNYEKAVGDFEYNQAVVKGDWDRVFQLGRQRLSQNPDNVEVLLDMARGGYFNAQKGAQANQSLTPEAIRATRRAIELVEQGKAPAKWEAFKGREDALGWLNFMLAYHLRKSSPDEAVAHFLKSVQFESTPKSDPATYAFLAEIYQDEFNRLGREYKAKYEGQPETDESKIALEKINRSADRMMDALARAVSHANDPARKKAWTEQLRTVYKFRNNESDAGLDAYIASVRTKPLPDPRQEPAITVPSTSAEGGTVGATTQPVTDNRTNSAPANTTAPKTETKPANTTQPAPATKPSARGTAGAKTGAVRRS